MTVPRLLVTAALCLTQAGCAVFSPVPALELAKATATAASTAISYGPSRARHTVRHEHAPVQSICIEYNRQAPVQDVLPALQAELRALHIDSRVYDTGSTAEGCAVWLRYAASMDWGIPPFASEHRAYLTAAALSLQTADGRILSSSQYELDTVFGLGKWSTTRSKISPVVVALITGFEN